MIKVTMAEIRELRYCASGARTWCAQNGFDFRELVKTGLDANAVEATGDQFGVNAALLAKEKARR